MSAQAASLVRTFSVGRYRCTLIFPPPKRGDVLAMAAEWSPSTPDRLTSAELALYREGRNRALKELAEIVGGNVAVIE